MSDALDKIPGTSDVRAVVMLDDGEGGCVHPHNYPEPVERQDALLFIDTAAHLVEMGKALGVKVEMLVNGKKVPGPAPEVPRG